MDCHAGELKEGLLPKGPLLEELKLLHSDCTREDGHAYSIRVVQAERVFEVERHFRDFCWLDEGIQAQGGVSTVRLPQKELFGISRRVMGTSTKELKTLERYLRDLLSQVKSVDEVPRLERFLGSSHHLQHRHCSTKYEDVCASVRQSAKHEVGHIDSVNYVAVSAGVRLIVSASEDATCRVWGLDKQKRWHCQQVLQGHTAGVDGVALPSLYDDSMIGTSSEDTTIRLWFATKLADDTFTYHCAHVLEGHTAAVRFLAIARDISFVVSVGDDSTGRLWRPSDGEDGTVWSCQAVLEGHEEPVYGVSIAPDLSIVATASDDKTCRIWSEGQDKQTWICLQVLEGHGGGLYSVNFSECGELLATTSADETCRIWGRKECGWELLQVLSGHKAEVYDVAIAPDKSLIATGDDSGHCNLWVREKGEEQWTLEQVLKGHRQTIYGVQIAPGRYSGELTISTGSADQTSIIWRYDGKHAYKATHIRPASDFEILMPVTNLCVSILQNAAMAFKRPTFANHGTMLMMKVTLSITVLSVNIHVAPEAKFVVQTLVALGLASLFLFCAWEGRFKTVAFFLSTALVIPITKQMFEVFNCAHGRLEVVPTISCCSSLHLLFAVPTAAVCFCYLLLIIGPYTAAEGDIELMPRHVWLHKREWFRRKRDKIVGLNLGLISPSRKGGVVYAYVSMFSRLLLLAISTFLHEHERRCCILSLAIACVTLLAIIIWPPMEHRIATVLLAAGQAFCVVAFLASTVSAELHDEWQLVPELVLFVGWAAILGALVKWLRKHGGYLRMATRRLSDVGAV
eukprot:CAMPEP_0175640148 /NCGR_PEP_ID=MMETSP0097-20121207/4100_1 /TAXON_ID=311494 /ORGANISM="Alexandrium monilatum, Strain CCMP3105" /LENGTH=798 /DNA_ID=CAMNT_0016945893 /DNA_START=1 /DNA_END=2396 /DNA_ORIENTATION=-